jgi:hypothetical protein
MTAGPGWYADPGAAGWWRWFDGSSWTPHTHPMQQPAFGYGYGAGYGAPTPPRDRGLEMLLPVNRAPLAIVAGYLGIFSLLLIPGPIAVAVSVMALRQFKTKPDVGGRGRAWFGLVAGSVASLILLIAVLTAIASG